MSAVFLLFFALIFCFVIFLKAIIHLSFLVVLQAIIICAASCFFIRTTITVLTEMKNKYFFQSMKEKEFSIKTKLKFASCQAAYFNICFFSYLHSFNAYANVFLYVSFLITVICFFFFFLFMDTTSFQFVH